MKINYPVFLSILEKIKELNNENHDYMVLMELVVNQNISCLTGIIKPNYGVAFTLGNLRVILDVLEGWSVVTVRFDKDCIFLIYLLILLFEYD